MTACLAVGSCRLSISDWQWPLADKHAVAIAEDWKRRHAENPALFDGTIYLARDYAIDGGALAATLFKTDFKTFLYWRAHRSDDGLRECFGASLIFSSEGHVLLGRQGPGQLNSGRVYPPSGLIDGADVRAASIDIDASIARELQEETGLGPASVQRLPGYLVAIAGVQIAVATRWRSELPALELRRHILSCLRAQPHPELDDIVIVRSKGDIDQVTMPPHACALLNGVLPA